ncbi:Hypothetical predicted protein [Mytilus galloprovincialis]|uniref:Uncharacterized protein n=1 Tax=Mytilus galloprovincialis TaxID=29158 RepID=A0A8B6C416_MYTGA|nr:Hypothetical predicted protein [Mytilus galloprovincialis]
MAQVLAVPGDVRHGFVYKTTFNNGFGRITGIAATTMGNMLLCDYDSKNVILVDHVGKYLNQINLESEPFDVAITSQNIGYITLPNIRSVLRIDPDRLVVLHKTTSSDQSTTVICVSAVPNSGTDTENKVPCYLGVSMYSSSYAYPVNKYHICLTPESRHVSSYGISIDPRVVKFLAVDVGSFVSCIGGQSYIKITKVSNLSYPNSEQTVNIETMVTPTDICSDNNGHIYVSGQTSNNIHRLTQDGKVLDIPLDSRHGIKQPVALCFNQNYGKLYIVNKWGKSVLIFDVI